MRHVAEAFCNYAASTGRVRRFALQSLAVREGTTFMRTLQGMRTLRGTSVGLNGDDGEAAAAAAV
jgi:hypothetical protein